MTRGPALRRALLLTGVALFALALRLVLMSARGEFLEFDETYYLLIAESLASGGGYSMNGLPQIAFPPLPALLLVALKAVFGAMVIPSRVASACFGALLVPVAHRITRRLFGRRAAIGAALLTAVCPSLMTFVPVEAGYAGRLYFGHEPLHLLLIHLTLWAGIGAMRHPSWRTGAAAGAAGALAYLTRNESLLFGGSLILLLVIAAFREGIARRRWAGATAAAIAFAAVASPYPLWLLHVSGSWMVSGKTGTAVAIREAVAARVRDDDPSGYEKAHYALDPSGRKMASTYWGYDGPRPEPPLAPTFRGALENASLIAAVVFPVLVPWPLWPLLLAGVFEIAASRRAGPAEARPLYGAAAALLALPSLAVVLFFFIEPRHHLYLVPVALALSAAGAGRLARMFRVKSGSAVFTAPLAGILLALSLAPMWRGEAAASREEAARLREMGEALAAELPPGEPVMSWHPALAFHAGRPWRVLPSAGLNRSAAYALSRGSNSIVFERAVFGPPPDEPEGEPAPFAFFRLDGIGAGDAEAGCFTARRVGAEPGKDGSPLYARYVLEGGSAPVRSSEP